MTKGKPAPGVCVIMLLRHGLIKREVIVQRFFLLIVFSLVIAPGFPAIAPAMAGGSVGFGGGFGIGSSFGGFGGGFGSGFGGGFRVFNPQAAPVPGSGVELDSALRVLILPRHGGGGGGIAGDYGFGLGVSSTLPQALDVTGPCDPGYQLPVLSGTTKVIGCPRTVVTPKPVVAAAAAVENEAGSVFGGAPASAY